MRRKSARKQSVKRGKRTGSRRQMKKGRRTYKRSMRTARRQRGGQYATVDDYRSGHFNKGVDQLLLAKNPSTYQQALAAANTPVPGINTVYKGGRRYARRHRTFHRRMRGGMTQPAANCPTWHGAGGPCVPQPVAYNGPYGAIPIHQTAGLYPKQV